MKSRKPICGIRAHYRRVNRKTRRDWQRLQKSLRAGLERDTGLAPWLVAETVCDEVSCFLDVELPVRYPLWLDTMAEHYYQRNAEFRRQMRAEENDARDLLYAFMRHWINALFFHERPDLVACLPPEYSIGRPLPWTLQPQIRRRSYGPLPAPRDWDASRVLKNDEWRWLEKLLQEKVRRGEIDLKTLRPYTYDALAHELYGLTDDKIKLVEDSQIELSKAQRKAMPGKQRQLI